MDLDRMTIEIVLQHRYLHSISLLIHRHQYHWFNNWPGAAQSWECSQTSRSQDCTDRP